MNTISSTTGMDDISNPDKKPLSSVKDWVNYPYPISYSINSRGFRDSEWPNNLDEVVWCLGDSFTKGVGVPFDHTWPSILQSQTKKRCINLGIDGAANRLILNIAIQIISEHNPKYMIIMWSYPNRRYKDPWNFEHYDSSATDNDDIKDFVNCFSSINTLLPNIYNTVVPLTYKLSVKNLYKYKVLDLGRDGHHFDYLTAEPIVDSIMQHFNFKRYDNEL
jgi:hypothetical protein